MYTVTISPKFQVVIPKDVRNRLKLKPGQKLKILQLGDRMEFVPVKELKEMKGFLKGIDTNIQREKDRV
ncbi:MAG: AbrB/MazE/SpoVT family DNA-binding domain-containing protein [Calditrichaceae bacterium]|nr:AbrB/MazE/SpoVT family DNA-binding domain-containing protein [Calditrichaceae bacterium]MBN2710580.1 AbrB/MazE/SpoVT family DNA-binding domain-containing protein [Calditrichaceae bacterium]RQV94122.1 MAG: AbrB/MazE/SpoVT family DNA-binding domain-containing protein [Calditrichota bacterium]